MCNLLTSFEETTLLGMSADKLTDLRARFRTTRPDAETTAFARRVQTAADALLASDISDKALRIRLWFRMMAALQLDPVLPLSKRSANTHGAAMAYKAAAIIGKKPQNDDNTTVSSTQMQRVWDKLKSVRGGEPVEFSSLVADQARLATQAVTEAARSELLNEEQKAALDQKLRDYIRQLPPELRDDAMRKALQASDKAALTLLLTGTSAFGIGLGVNLAGFGAYILAAQASAFIPMMSGPAAVSTLFLLANPLFSVPALIGGAYLANRHVTGGQAARLASLVAVQLTLRGLSADQDGLHIALNDFRTTTTADFTVLPYTFTRATMRKIKSIDAGTGHALSDTPGGDPAAHRHNDRNGRLLDGMLARATGDAAEVAAVGGLTASETANNPGFDLLVDGHPFQVKCLLGLSGLREHFAKYPDMPVYANSELAEAVIASGEVWTTKVFYVDGFDREIADLIMQTSLEAGDALGDLNVPYIAMAVSSARNLHRWWQGRIPLSDLPFSVMLEGSVKGGLAAIGGLSGKVLGLIAFGPAGALVLGGIGGVGALLCSGWTREQASQLLSSEWLAELDLATNLFRDALIETIQIKVDLLTNKRAQTLATGHPDCKWLAQRFSDDIVSLCEAMHQLRTDIPSLSQPTKARSCIEIMTTASVHPLAVESELKGLFELFGAEPSLTVAVSRKASEGLTALRSKNPKRT